MTDRPTLLATLDALLQPERFKDYCPNGLQVEGQWEVRKIVSGVTASPGWPGHEVGLARTTPRCRTSHVNPDDLECLFFLTLCFVRIR